MPVPKKLPPIADAEWMVMKLLWERSPRTAAEVQGALEPQTGWKPATVKTLLSRLVEKRAVTYTKEGKQFLYTPLVAEGDCVRAESRSFLDRVFGGSLTPMVAHMVEGRQLSKREVSELRKLLDEAERKADGGNR
jgi:BlaI family transcriptional regulator, penicillinase repressor